MTRHDELDWLTEERKRKIAQFVLELTERLYVAYGTDTGYLFGLPPNKRPMVEAIIDNAVVWTLSAFHDEGLDEELGVVGPRVKGRILHFPHDDKPWTPATHFRATGSHSSLALANGLIGIDGEDAEAIIIALSGTGKEGEK